MDVDYINDLFIAKHFCDEKHNIFIDFWRNISRICAKLDKGKPPEKAGRKVTGLSLKWDMAAGLPDGLKKSSITENPI